MAIKLHDTFPAVMLKILTDDGLKEINTAQYFEGKKVIIIGLPGAYTPVCTSRHIPEFAQASSEIKAKGVDEIICLSVNDAFVMRAWGESMKALDKITFLGDDSCELTTKLGLDIDLSEHGLGKRCARCALVVDDGKITGLYVEDNPGQCSISSAASILKALDI